MAYAETSKGLHCDNQVKGNKMTLSQKYTPEAIAERRHELERMEQLWAENRNLRTVIKQLTEALEEIVQMERLPIVTSRYSHKLRYDKMSSIAQAALAEAKEME